MWVMTSHEWLGYRLRADGGDVQEPHAATQTDRHEVGADPAAGLMNLVALREGGQWEQSLRGSGQDWQTRKTA